MNVLSWVGVSDSVEYLLSGIELFIRVSSTQMIQVNLHIYEVTIYGLST